MREKADQSGMTMDIRVNGEVLTLDASGALCWATERTLIFSDLHLEKGSSFARRGTFLPPYDTRETIARMRAAIDRYSPTRVIALGDSFHDVEAAERMGEAENRMLHSLSRGRDWIWIAGNHDPSPPAWLGGTIASEVAVGGLVFRHEPQACCESGEIAGHFHPCATAVRRGRGLRRPCFITDGHRLILPAFGAFTGGLDVNEAPIATLFPDGFATYMLGARRVYAIGGSPHVLKRNLQDSTHRTDSRV